MPVIIPPNIWRPNQTQFGEIAYRVMEVIFNVHNELGRFLREEIFHLEIASRLPGSIVKLPIKVVFDDFEKPYYLDLLIDNGVPFELKAVETLAPRHRAQLLHYQLLLELAHGKLVNLRSESVEHEFVNTQLTRTDRIAFAVLEDGWEPVWCEERELKEWLVEFLRDVGVGLDLHLYVDAVTHFFGGEEKVLSETPVIVRGRQLGVQRVRLAAPGVALKLSTVPEESCQRFDDHARRFMAHSPLKKLLWINMNRQFVRFAQIVPDDR